MRSFSFPFTYLLDTGRTATDNDVFSKNTQSLYYRNQQCNDLTNLITQFTPRNSNPRLFKLTKLS